MKILNVSENMITKTARTCKKRWSTTPPIHGIRSCHHIAIKEDGDVTLMEWCPSTWQPVPSTPSSEPNQKATIGDTSRTRTQFLPQMLVAVAYDCEVSIGEILTGEANEGSYIIKYMHRARKQFTLPNPEDIRTTLRNCLPKVCPVVVPAATTRSLRYFVLGNEAIIMVEYVLMKKWFTA